MDLLFLVRWLFINNITIILCHSKFINNNKKKTAQLFAVIRVGIAVWCCGQKHTVHHSKFISKKKNHLNEKRNCVSKNFNAYYLFYDYVRPLCT